MGVGRPQRWIDVSKEGQFSLPLSLSLDLVNPLHDIVASSTISLISCHAETDALCSGQGKRIVSGGEFTGECFTQQS
jgi:hypothetical protein